MPRPVSVFYHDKQSYDCRHCGKPMNRHNIHGWFWGCAACGTSYPLYVLEPKAPEVEKRGLLEKAKELFQGRKNG